MKFLRWLPFLLLSFTFVSCMDTREELDIKSDGSGTLAVRTDLGKMLEMMKGFASPDDIKKEGLEKAYDTTILMKDFVDTAKDVTAEQKAALRNGKLHLALDMQQSKGKFDMHFPFSSPAQLQVLYESLNSTNGGMKGLLGNKGKKTEGDGNSMIQQNDKGIPQITSVYDIAITNNLYSRKVNQQRYQEFADAMKLDDLKQMGGMLGPMNYTLAIKLPRPIKKISNSKAELSTDKLTATLSTDLMEAFQHPELLALDIEY